MKFLTPRHETDVKRMWQLVPILLILSFLVAHFYLWPLKLYDLSMVALCLLLAAPKSWRKMHTPNRTIYPFWQVITTIWLIQISIMGLGFSVLALSPTWITPPYTLNNNYLNAVMHFYIQLPLFPWGLSLCFTTLISYACTKKDTIAWVDIWPLYQVRWGFLASNISFINSRIDYINAPITYLILIILWFMSHIFSKILFLPNQGYTTLIAICITQYVFTHKKYAQNILQSMPHKKTATLFTILLMSIFIAMTFYCILLAISALSSTLTFLQLSIGSGFIHWLSPPQLFNVWTLILTSMMLGLALIFNRLIVYLSHGHRSGQIIIAGLTLPAGIWAMEHWHMINWTKLFSYPPRIYQLIFLISLALILYALTNKKTTSLMTMPYMCVKDRPKFRHPSKFIQALIIGTITCFTLTFLGGIGILALVQTTMVLPTLIIGAPVLIYLSWQYFRMD